MKKSPGHQKWPNHKIKEEHIGKKVTVEVDGDIPDRQVPTHLGPTIGRIAGWIATYVAYRSSYRFFSSTSGWMRASTRVIADRNACRRKRLSRVTRESPPSPDNCACSIACGAFEGDVHPGPVL